MPKLITEKNACLGVDEWDGGCLPASKYEFSNPETSEWKALDDSDDESVHEIMRWVYRSKVLKVPGCDIVFEEELRFHILSCQLDTSEIWSCKVTVFDVRCQEERLFHFRLR